MPCKGAEIPELTSPHERWTGEGEQFAALTESTRLVTITIGGNDAWFAPLLKICLALPDCHDLVVGFFGGGTDPVAQQINSLYPELHNAFIEIRSRAPNASVWVLPYPSIFNGDTCVRAAGFSTAEQEWLMALGDQLNGVIEEAAKSAGVHFAASVAVGFTGHEVCSAVPWVNGISWPVVHSFHPNASGHRQIATLLVQGGIVDLPGNPGADTTVTGPGDTSQPPVTLGSPVDIGEIVSFVEDTIRPGRWLAFEVPHLQPLAWYDVFFYSQPLQLDPIQADAAGTLHVEFQIPDDAEPGLHVVTIVGPHPDEGTAVRVGSVTVVPEISMERLAGPTRYETAVEISQAHFPSGAATVLVATGEAFPDALAGSVAAAQHTAPVLLVRHNLIPDATAAELTRLAPDRIVVLGGPGAISDDVAIQLAAFTDGPVTRLAGPTRYETAAAIADAVFPSDVPPDGQVYAATGENFPDALAGSVMAGLRGAPVLLVPTASAVPSAILQQMGRLTPAQLIVLGGTGAVSQQVVDELLAAAR